MRRSQLLFRFCTFARFLMRCLPVLAGDVATVGQAHGVARAHGQGCEGSGGGYRPQYWGGGAYGNCEHWGRGGVA